MLEEDEPSPFAWDSAVSQLLNPMPKGSNVVSFGGCYVVLVRDYHTLPKKELRWRVWVNPKFGESAFATIPLKQIG